MLSVEKALQLVLQHALPLRPAPLALADACGCILGEPISSDVDSPPHDKSVVDGYAVISADITATGVELTVLEEVTAGSLPKQAVETGTATRIMTGAPLPAGADAVIMVEQTDVRGERVVVRRASIKPGQNIV